MTVMQETQQLTISNTLFRDTLADQVAQRLLDIVVEEDLKPGETLPSAKHLTEEFEVSRSVIREALKSLEGKGVIKVVNGKGAIVQPVDSKPLHLYFRRTIQIEQKAVLELMEVREPLEIQSAGLAAQRRTDDELDEIKRIVDSMSNHLGEPEEFLSLDVKLHICIAKATHNKVIYHVIRSIRESLEDAIRTGLDQLTSEDDWQHTQRLHDELVATIAEGRPSSAREAMAAHFERAVSKLVEDSIS